MVRDFAWCEGPPGVFGLDAQLRKNNYLEIREWRNIVGATEQRKRIEGAVMVGEELPLVAGMQRP
ncbi:hypothetical protein [Sphingobium sp.]|uniref:hypothetical protein n=1 Tax=Sphingobium sp. TaxID=1912891 RepID=UPI0035C72F2B